MSQPEFLDAAFTRKGDEVEARLGLLLDNHVEEVWALLTRPEQLPAWLAPGEIEPRVGGRAHLNFPESGVVIDSLVTAWEPRRLLEYSWSSPGEPARPLRWALEPVGNLTRLTLTLTVPGHEDVARSCAGWAAHLEMLAASAAGVSIKFPFEIFKAARAAYGAQLATEGQMASASQAG